MGSRHKTIAVLCAAVALSAACKRELVEVRDTLNPGETRFRDALGEYAAHPDDAKSYAKFAAEIREVKPLLNLELAREAELRLSLMAFSHLNKISGHPWDVQAEEMVSTLWPEILDQSKLPQETTKGYLFRVCRGALSLECQRVAPPGWPAVVGGQVWKRMAERADSALKSCRDCDGRFNERSIVDSYQARLRDVEASVEKIREDNRPRRWPTPFPGLKKLDPATPLIECNSDGDCRVGEGDFSPGWQKQWQTNAPAAVVLHVEPQATIKAMVSATRELEKLGVELISLMLRDSGFPYQARELPLGASRTLLRGLRLEPSDPVQLWVQARAALN